MNPLEDVYVAVKAKAPVTPFGLPKSTRLLDPSQEVGATLGFTNIDPTTGQAPRYQEQLVNGLTTKVSVNGAYSNKLTDFDNEYVWHCHILGHEEQDFMRPFIFHPNVIVPDAPAAVAVSSAGVVTWIDTTPFGGQDAQGIPTAGTNAAYPEPMTSPKNEVGFKVYRGNTLAATLPANTTAWTDPSGSSPSVYTVVAYNAAGDSAAGTQATLTSAGGLNGTGSGPTGSTATAGTAVVATVAGPTGLTQTLNADKSVTLNWTGMAGATGYVVSINGVAQAPTVATSVNIASSQLAAGSNKFSVMAQALSGNSSLVTTNLSNAKALPPVALKASQGNANLGGRGTVTLTWANNSQNVNNVAGLYLTWALKGAGVSGFKTFDPKSTGATIIGLSSDKEYDFTLTAKSNITDSTSVTVRALSAP